MLGITDMQELGISLSDGSGYGRRGNGAFEPSMNPSWNPDRLCSAA